MVVGNFEWLAALCLVLLGLVFAPFYFRSRVATLPEFLEKRFSAGSRTMLAVMGIFGALFVHIGVSLYSGGVVVDELLSPGSAGVDRGSIITSILIVSALTVTYTVLGGLKAVVVTESIQTILLLLGAPCSDCGGHRRAGRFRDSGEPGLGRTPAVANASRTTVDGANIG